MPYGHEGVCPHCKRNSEFCTITVRFNLPGETHVRYYCPKCAIVVELPAKTEGRFLASLPEYPTDSYGKPSTFRGDLADMLRPLGSPNRQYSLVTIPPLMIACPQDGQTMLHWSDYPSDRELICPHCGNVSTSFETMTCMYGQVIVDW